jgi:hypothetical protein
VLRGKLVYGAFAELVVDGFVRPESDANTLVPQVSVDKRMRSAFVEADPVVVHDSCRSQLAVNVHARTW